MCRNINTSFANVKHNVCINDGYNPVNFLFMNDETKRVRQQYLNLGMTNPDFQRAANIKSQDWNNWQNRGIPKNRLVDVSLIIHRSVHWILTGTDNYIDGQIIRHGLPLISDINETKLGYSKNINRSAKFPPVIGLVKGGDNGFYDPIQNGFVDIVAPDGTIALKVVGHSMHPAIREGWFIIISPDRTPAINGFVLVNFKDGRKIVKELLRQDMDSYLLESVNGGERLTVARHELDESGIQAVAFIASPDMHRDYD